MSERIYLDHAASARLSPSVLAAMTECLQSGESNPAARYARAAREQIARASGRIASLVGAKPESVFYTSGATESDNWAIYQGVKLKPQARTIVSALTEHAAVVESIKYAKRQGYQVRWLPVDKDGLVTPQVLHQHLDEGVALVSLMLVNNESGVIHDIAALASVCQAHQVPLHVDAAQAPGRVPVCFDEWGVDAMSLSAHKQHGPTGVGALLLKEPHRWQALLHGGGQQANLRSGTLAVHQIVGMGAAYRLANHDLTEQPLHFVELNQLLWQGLNDRLEGLHINAEHAPRSAHILSVRCDGVDGDALHALLAPTLSVSLGSACHSENGEPSTVLRSLGLTDPQMAATVRFSIGRDTSRSEIAAAVETVVSAVTHLRALAP